MADSIAGFINLARQGRIAANARRRVDKLRSKFQSEQGKLEEKQNQLANLMKQDFGTTGPLKPGTLKQDPPSMDIARGQQDIRAAKIKNKLLDVSLARDKADVARSFLSSGKGVGGEGGGGFGALAQSLLGGSFGPFKTVEDVNGFERFVSGPNQGELAFPTVKKIVTSSQDLAVRKQDLAEKKFKRDKNKFEREQPKRDRAEKLDKLNVERQTKILTGKIADPEDKKASRLYLETARKLLKDRLTVVNKFGAVLNPGMAKLWEKILPLLEPKRKLGLDVGTAVSESLKEARIDIKAQEMKQGATQAQQDGEQAQADAFTEKFNK